MPRVLCNLWTVPGFTTQPPEAGALAVHRRLPGYVPTPLRSLSGLAERIGVARVELKDESARLGLPAYKILGATWATYRALARRLGRTSEPWRDVTEWRALLRPFPRLQLVAATDGNHGRGVARVARWLGLPAVIYLPAGSAEARLAGIRSEGAQVIEVEGTYDAAVAQAAAAEGEDVLLIQDHGWPGYEDIPA